MDRVLKIIPDHSSGCVLDERFVVSCSFWVDAALKGDCMANYPDGSLFPLKSFFAQEIERVS
ncbi:MAG: hypothetical protein GY799_20170 [Desulfobulbaceae bacterium]|nr:hypothetical protein [Desulfobulbaceae bacterium]